MTTYLSPEERQAIDGLLQIKTLTKVCAACKKRLPRNYFSMTTNNLDLGQGNPRCNDCLIIGGKKNLFKANDPSDWELRASCAGSDPEIFHPFWGDDRWKKYCGDCPVVAQCTQRGEETGSSGVWGGVLWENPTYRKRQVVGPGATRNGKMGRVPLSESLTPEQQAEVLQMRTSGSSFPEIGVRFGVTANTAARCVRSLVAAQL